MHLKSDLFALFLFSLGLIACSDRNIKVTASIIAPHQGDLSHAVVTGSEPDVAALLAKGSDINENIGTPEQPITPLMLALAYGESPNDKMAAYLLDQGANPDVVFKSKKKGIPFMSVRQWICQSSEAIQSAQLSLPITRKKLGRKVAANSSSFAAVSSAGVSYNEGCIDAIIFNNHLSQQDRRRGDAQ